MVDALQDTLTKVNEWIKFAETKNAANVVFCSTAIFGLSRLIIIPETINTYFFWYVVFAISFLILSLAISMFSFIPRLKAPWLYIGERKEEDNLLYFGDACKYSAVSYLEKIRNGSLQEADNYELEMLYANQIVINSRVAFIKFKQFDLAIWFTAAAMLSPLGVLIAWALKE